MIELHRRWGKTYENAAIKGHRDLVEQGKFDDIPLEDDFPPGQQVVTRDSHLAFTVLASLGDKLKIGHQGDTKYIIKNVFKVDTRSLDKYLEVLNQINESDIFYAENLSEPSFSSN